MPASAARSEYVDQQAERQPEKDQKRTRIKLAPQIWGPGAVQWIFMVVGVRHCGLLELWAAGATGGLQGGLCVASRHRDGRQERCWKQI